MASEGDVHIRKPSNDKRSYRTFKLGNDLQVLLVSDPDTDKAGASMDVNVGYFSDPEDVPGLAHFLEHMLFYSSEKYPVEDSYSKFLAEHGGRSNAYTSSENTNYYFDVNHDHLSDALDRFAQFFICPLMSADATSREMNAVDSENSKNLTSDPWRFHQLQKHLSSPDHPYHKFGTGNLATLETTPKDKGVDAREELIKFHDLHYSANLMHLVVYGRESLDSLQKLAEDRFSAIKNTKKEAPRFPGTIWLPEHVKTLVKAVPVAEGHTLDITWPIPPFQQIYRAYPDRYLSHLIGHESDGSIFALLKSLGWANSLSAGAAENSLDYAFFHVSIELTKEGQEHMEEIVSLVFQYISILREQGVQQWIFDEVCAVAKMSFNFRDKGPPFFEVARLSSNMRLYEVEDWVAGPLPKSFEPATIHNILDSLTPLNAKIFWCSKTFEKEAKSVEPWYGTQFIATTFSDEQIKAWTATDSDKRLHLPKPNVFIPTDFAVKKADPEAKYPVLQKKTDLSRLWYKPDPKFQTPKAYIYLEFSLPASYVSPETSLLTRLFTKLLYDYLNEYAYNAQIAGLHYYCDQTVGGFQVEVSGYNHKILVLLEKIVEKIAAFEVVDDRFDVWKEKTAKDLSNFRYEQPYQQAMYELSVMLEQRRWHLLEVTQVLPNTTADDLRAFLPTLLSRAFIDCYIAGNMGGVEAEEVVQRVEKTLESSSMAKTRPVFPSQLPERRIVQLKPNTDAFYPMDGLNPQDANSCALVYFQVGKEDLQLNMAAQLFVQTAKREAFYQLRTVEQLGYIVSLDPRADCAVQGIQFLVQSSVKGPAALEERVEAFVASFEKKLNDLSDDEFKLQVAALVALKEERHKSLREESRKLWKEIDDGTLLFNRVPLEVGALQKITKGDLVEFYNLYIKHGGAQRRKLSVLVNGGLEGKASTQATKKDEQQEGEAIGSPTVTSEATSKVSADSDGVVEETNPGTRQEGRTSTLEAPRLKIDNLPVFKRSQSLFPSSKHAPHPLYAAQDTVLLESSR